MRESEVISWSYSSRRRSKAKSAPAPKTRLRLLPSKTLRALRWEIHRKLCATPVKSKDTCFCFCRTIRRAYTRRAPMIQMPRILWGCRSERASTIDRRYRTGIHSKRMAPCLGKNRKSIHKLRIKHHVYAASSPVQRRAPHLTKFVAKLAVEFRTFDCRIRVFRSSVSRNSVEQHTEVHDTEVHMVRAVDCAELPESHRRRG